MCHEHEFCVSDYQCVMLKRDAQLEPLRALVQLAIDGCH
jgi:hypothetical protein